jgi:mono/diheme cytochrome c family protein
MATGMNLQRLVGALLLSLLASLCYAQEKGEPVGSKEAGKKADAQSPPPADGALLYKQYCQACHMADGKGAIGAGAYPALANNPKLQTAAYPVVVVMYGKAGMPWFNGLLKPEEIAAIVSYVRTNFGNNYAEPVTAQEVATMRGPVPTDE